MKLYLQYTNASHRGPGMVVQNLLKGLQTLGVDVQTQPQACDYYGCLQPPGAILNHLPKQTLMGPNIFVIPSENMGVVNRFQNHVVPCEWVKDVYNRWPDMQSKNINVWPVGIDTDKWQPLDYWTPLRGRLDCFIYVKNRDPNDVGLVENACRALGLSYEINQYGAYTQESLLTRCVSAKFAILLTDTESQGIAYMNILSTGTPCYVINKAKWEYRGIQAPATSVPYFDKRCGEIVDNAIINRDHLEQFVNNLNTYDPRQYILDNHTLVKGAENYVTLLKAT